MTITATATRARDARTGRLPRGPIGGLIVGAAVFGVVSLVQAFTREGFDLTRYPLSMLSNGDLGWIQITNFVVSGLLTVVGAVGLRRALRGTPGGTWAPRLVAVWGTGLFLSGPFVLQGGGGFPVGDPGQPGLTVGSIGHLAIGTVAFGCLIAANYVLGRHYARAARPGMAAGSRIAATAFVVGDLYSMSGGPAGSLVLAVTCLWAMTWLGVVAYTER